MKKLTAEEIHGCVGGLVLYTGLNNLKNGVNSVQAPDAAVGGAITAFTAVISKGPGLLDNITPDFSS